MTTIDYGLTGPAQARAVQAGLANAEWFLADIDPARLRQLQERTDARATVDALLWIGLLIASGAWAIMSWRSWWSLPAFAVYGALYGGAADPRWHEMGHGTAFRSRWANDLVYPVASFMLLRGPTLWRWSHYRHHTDTIIVGRDAEIAFMRPADVARTLGKFSGLAAFGMFARLVRHAFARLDPDARELVPATEHRRVVWEARGFVAVIAAVVIASVVAWSPLPILLIGGPSVYGMWLMVFFGITQHAGLREDMLDHRYNTRTVYMNPVLRFLYLNMNYHVEHHMFPSVPYRALPALHAEIKDQLAPPLPSTFAAYRQIFTTLIRQQRDDSYEIPLAVPDVPGHRHRIDVGETNWTHGPDGAIDLGAADALEVGELRRVDVGMATYVLVRLSADEFTLADGRCTHAEVHLAGGALVDGCIECPKHNARFDARTGAVVRKPAKAPIGTYAVERVAGRLVTRELRHHGATPRERVNQ